MTEFLTRSKWGPADYLAAVASVVFAALAAYWWAFDVRSRIDVQSIAVRGLHGEPVLKVERKLTGNFDGRYQVTIRDVQDGRRVCTTGQIEGPYRERTQGGQLVHLPDPTTLKWWAAGGSCDDVLKEGLPDGHYSMRTCHSVRPLPFGPFKERCWPLTFFDIPPQ